MLRICAGVLVRILRSRRFFGIWESGTSESESSDVGLSDVGLSDVGCRTSEVGFRRSDVRVVHISQPIKIARSAAAAGLHMMARARPSVGSDVGAGQRRYEGSWLARAASRC